MSDPAAVRDQLATALEVVLPGRVTPFPPTSKRYVTPAIFVEQVTITPGDGTIVGTFPVWILVDGAVQAQLAAHDDIVWNCYLALWPLADDLTARPQQMAGLRATVIDVEIELAAITLCGLDTPVEAEIPPATLAG